MSDFVVPQNIHQAGVAMAEFGSDARLYVQFYARSVHMPRKSEEEGRPVFESRDYIKIMQPGERDCMDREVTELDKMRFPRHWDAYSSKREQVPDGTPIDILYPQDPHICETLRHLKVFTIEQLAAASEAAIGRMGMGGRQYVERAKVFLAQSAGMKGAHELQRQVDAANDQIASLKAMLQQLQEAQQSGARKGKDNGTRD